VSERSGYGGCTGSHTYAAAGEHTVRVTVRDDEGAEGSAAVPVAVAGPVADLALTAPPFPTDQVRGGETYEIPLTVTNLGPSTTNVAIYSYADEILTYHGVECGAGGINDGEYTCLYEAVPSGGRVTATMVVPIRDGALPQPVGGGACARALGAADPNPENDCWRFSATLVG
jgi:hypothetical protein